MREREGPETAFGSPDGPPGQAAEGFFARICTEGRAEPWMADVWRSRSGTRALPYKDTEAVGKNDRTGQYHRIEGCGQIFRGHSRA